MGGIVSLGTVGAAALLALAPAPAFADEAEVHTFHCLHSCPVGAPETNDLIVREIYTLSSNDATKLADWVAYRITPGTIGPSGDRDWEPDPWLAPDETLEPDDYRGANAALRVDRGHQAPLASFSGTPHAADTNFLSNITPQRSDLNQGSWVRLENAERTFVTRTGTALYVLTGPLFEGAAPPLPQADEPHRVPSGYWKILATADGRASAFLFPQETPRGRDHCALRTTIAEVERRAILRVFPRLDRRPLASLDAELGCN